MSVQQNLLRGLHQIGYPVRLNPREPMVTSQVGVLSDHHGALQWAIRAKREGRIKHLVAGPNLVVTPAEHDRILTDPAIDLVITPSKWVSEMYLQVAPDLAGRLAEWPVGVNEKYWRPKHKTFDKKLDFLVYDKIFEPENRALLSAATSELTRRRLSFEVLEYGSFEQAQFRHKLWASHALLYLTESETQGIALFEAWACNVPTLVWDRSLWRWKDFRMEGASSAPYLTPECGLRFHNVAEFPTCLDKFLSILGDFTPREFILNRFTRKHGAWSYLNLFGINS